MAATLQHREHGIVEMGCVLAEVHRSPFGRDLLHNAMHQMGLKCDMCDEHEGSA
ncbi:hypothetical protein NTE_01885 [Candidatus Nitrososphaera evergladensis SR1]|uniref:Uncharacterized protein n=1 Tax=Candidatus Nitrososphaera evergladensis SR1 TaxID=1459636 RepID=A0A075MXB5_9ARCH|nr:hypothetical protein NTE_01885 [Candidatus Nitrososphaera evergladensis SR1]